MKKVSHAIDPLALSARFRQSICIRRKFFSYHLVLLLTCITLFIISCKKEGHKGKETVSFEAVFQIKSAIIQTGPPTLITATGTGDGTPIGKSAFVGHAKVDAGNNFTDEGTITAANGDLIYETAKGPGPVVDADGNLLIISANTITGGTGKYAGATGSYTTIAHASTKSPDGVDSLKGTITLNR